MFDKLRALISRQASSSNFFKFNDAQLQALAAGMSETYKSAKPFPHVVIDDFLPPRVAEELLAAFPPPDDPIWFDWRQGDTVNQPKKLGVRHASRMEPAQSVVHNICYAFNGYPFIHFLERLTGFENLLPDPCLIGGGMHQILPGGRLNIHADFNYADGYGLYRKINALLYLNKDWEDSYAGHLELWDHDMVKCHHRIAPIFNRCVIFTVEGRSYHGHPEPLACPENMTRKSMAFYYYSKEPDARELGRHGTLWQSRPMDAAK
jgi:hypothetical protein